MSNVELSIKPLYVLRDKSAELVVTCEKHLQQAREQLAEIETQIALFESKARLINAQSKRKD